MTNSSYNTYPGHTSHVLLSLPACSHLRRRRSAGLRADMYGRAASCSSSRGALPPGTHGTMGWIEDAVRLLKNSTAKQRLTSAAVIGLGLYAFSGAFSGSRSASQLERTASLPHIAEEKSKKRKGSINKEFLKQLRLLLGIVLPGVFSKEFLLLVLHTAFLVARTFLSIHVAALDGEIVKSIVERKGEVFAWNILKWLGMAVPATYINSMIRFLESKLSIAFRTRLNHHFYRLYMNNDTFYRVENLDSRLCNADQCLTEDVSKFCSNLAHLHSQLSKPVLDVLLMGGQLILLAREKTGQGSALMPTVLAGAVVWLTTRVLRSVTPPFGQLVAEQARREGRYRYTHSRLIANAEEVAFYGGHDIEHSILLDSYTSLVKHMNTIYQLRVFYSMIEGFFMKYVWSACGMCMIALPAFYSKFSDHDELASSSVSTRTQDFVTARGLLISAADAVERIMSSYKEVTELAGYTSRVYEMQEVFEDVKNGHYRKGRATEIDLSVRGTVQVSERIEFQDVPIVSPNGDVLVEALSFAVKPGQNLLITGPNGCGKSSLFRILGGLWPVFGGSVLKPDKKDIFYIPQRPYLSIGTLRDQVIYPDTAEDFNRKGYGSAQLDEVMRIVNLQYLVDREGGWDAVNEWPDVLSGGEKQRVAMARLFYHKPKYAILDECTSAVSVDVEGTMYTAAKESGITLLTVSHRPTLWKYHEWLLQFDGSGGWKFSQLNAVLRTSLREEKEQLEGQLIDVPKMTKRLHELCEILGEDSVVLRTPGEGDVVEEAEVVK